MSENVFNYDAAYKFAKSLEVSSVKARSALTVLHQWYLQWVVHTEPALETTDAEYIASYPTDCLTFYKAVASTLEDGAAFGDDLLKARVRTGLTNVEEAAHFLEGLSDTTSVAMLRKFIAVCVAGSIPAGSQLDLLYCCQVLSQSAFSADRIGSVTSGQIAMESDELLVDRERIEWF